MPLQHAVTSCVDTKHMKCATTHANTHAHHSRPHVRNTRALPLQDTSRNFLCGSVADRKKYELFMAATLLADMQAALAKAQAFVDEMRAELREANKAHA